MQQTITRQTCMPDLSGYELAEEAKRLLMEFQGMSEPEAHRYLQIKSMEQRIPKYRIAEEIILQFSEKSVRTS